MGEAEDLLARYLKAQQNKDLDALVSCWHPDVEVVHPMRPDRNWSGLDTYRRQWKLIWERTPHSRFEVVSTAVVGDRVYLEALTEMSDGTMVPHMSVLRIRDGKIWRGRVYTDKPRHDGIDIDRFAREVNPAQGTAVIDDSHCDLVVGGAAALPDPVDRFFRAVSDHNVEGLRACLHPDFEMVVPQQPARGFKGSEQEISNMLFLFDTYPDFSVTVLRHAVSGNEVWTETTAQATGLAMAAVVIWTIDPRSGTIIAGRYYSESVQQDAPEINEFMRSIGYGGRAPGMPTE